MRCIIPSRGVKLFGKAVQCVAKIGEELYLEGLPDALTLRTVNSARSAFACISFHRSFFQLYSMQQTSKRSHQMEQLESSQEMDNAHLRCKLAAKSCLTVFRSLSSLEKTVDRCTIELDVPDSRLVFILHCKHGITKTYNLGFQECETLQAVFTKDLCVNTITAQAKVLQDVVANFVTSLEEVTMSAAATELSLKNYVEDEPDPSKALLTETFLQPGEFDNYCVGVDSSLTFCLKELRAILTLLEATGQPITMHFDTGGKPIVFSIDSDVTYEADFVLATIQEQVFDPSQSLSQGLSQQLPRASQGQNLTSKNSSTQLTSSHARKTRGSSSGKQDSVAELGGDEWPDDPFQPSDQNGFLRSVASTGQASNSELLHDEDNFNGYPPASVSRGALSSQAAAYGSAHQPAEHLRHRRGSAEMKKISDISRQADVDFHSTHGGSSLPGSSEVSQSAHSSGVRGFSFAPPPETPPVLRPSSSFNALQSPVTPFSTQPTPARGIFLPTLGDSEGGTPSDLIEPSPQVSTQSRVYPLPGNHSKQPHSFPPPSFDLSEAVADDGPYQNDSGGDEFDTVPGTPPKKKFCSLFFGAPVKPSAIPQALASGSEVLAEDTDEESD